MQVFILNRLVPLFEIQKKSIMYEQYTPLPPPDQVGFTIDFSINYYFVCQFLKMNDYSLCKHSWIITKTMYLVKNKTVQQQTNKQEQNKKTKKSNKNKKSNNPQIKTQTKQQQQPEKYKQTKQANKNKQTNVIKKTLRKSYQKKDWMQVCSFCIFRSDWNQYMCPNFYCYSS